LNKNNTYNPTDSFFILYQNLLIMTGYMMIHLLSSQNTLNILDQTRTRLRSFLVLSLWIVLQFPTDMPCWLLLFRFDGNVLHWVISLKKFSEMKSGNILGLPKIVTYHRLFNQFLWTAEIIDNSSHTFVVRKLRIL
jgi:hypothetical protein